MRSMQKKQMFLYFFYPMPLFINCKTIHIGDLKASRCSLPFQDCRLEIKRQNNWNCVERTECLPARYHNGTIKHYWCSTVDTFHGDWHNYGVCENSCPKSSTYVNP